MRMQAAFGILAVCLIAGNATTGPAGRAGEDRKPPTTIRAEDIGPTVTVLGRLGRPLREVTTVRGSWVASEPARSKPGAALRFRVTHVNGQPLPSPVDFGRHEVTVTAKPGDEAEPVKGEQWELRAYETWPVRTTRKTIGTSLAWPRPRPRLRA